MGGLGHQRARALQARFDVEGHGQSLDESNAQGHGVIIARGGGLVIEDGGGCPCGRVIAAKE